MVTTWGQTILKTPAVSRECFGKDLEHRSPTSSNAAWDPFRGLAPPDRCPLVMADGAARGVYMAGLTRFKKPKYSTVLKGDSTSFSLNSGCLDANARNSSGVVTPRHREQNSKVSVCPASNAFCTACARPVKGGHLA